MRQYFPFCSVQHLILPFALISIFLSACGRGTQYDRQNVISFLASEDPFSPKLELVGPASMTAEAGEVFQDPGAIAYSLKAGDLSSQIQKIGSVNSDRIGQYEIQYILDSLDYPRVSKSRFVSVKDTIPPSVSLVGSDSIVLERCASSCGSFEDPGINIQDSFDPNPSYTSEGGVDLTQSGIYRISYQGSDASGNLSPILERRIEVRDTTAPPAVALSFSRVSPTNDASNLLVTVDASPDVAYVQLISRSSINIPNPSLDCQGQSFNGASQLPISNQLSVSLSLVANKWNYFCARGRDLDGNFQVEISYSEALQVDTIPPEPVEIGSLGASPSNDQSPRVISISSPDSAAYQYKAFLFNSLNSIGDPISECETVNFNSLSWISISSPYTANVQTGYNLVCAIGRDLAGNIQTNISTSSVLQIDVDGPDLHINEPLDGFLINQASGTIVHVSGSCSEIGSPVLLSNSMDSIQPSCVPMGGSGEFSGDLDFSHVPDGPVSIIAVHTDSANNSTQVSVAGRKDVTPPVITLLGSNPLERSLCENLNDPGAQAIDAIDGAVNVQSSNDVDQLVSNPYSIEYSATDSAGNSSSLSRIVNYSLVIDDISFDRAIASSDGWASIQNDENLSLCHDINFNNMKIDPISEFSGVLNARGFSLSSFQIGSQRQDEQALFVRLNASAILKNLRLLDGHTLGDDYLAVLAAYNSGQIENVRVENSSVIKSGGGNSVTAGALVANNLGIISKSASIGNSILVDTQAGGLVGYNSGVIIDSYSRGNQVVANSAIAGGLIGVVASDSGELTNLYSASNVQTSTNQGGLIGINLQSLGTLTSCYFDSLVGGPYLTNDESLYGHPRTTEEMKNQSTYLGWDFLNTWIIETDSYPDLR